MSIPPPPVPPQPQEPQGPYPQGQFPQPPYAQAPYAQAPYGEPPYPPGPYGAQGPYAQPYPYQPWGQGYSPYNRPAPVNGLAVASLVLGILCCVPAAGLLLGLIALGQIRRTGERGRGMAVAGSVLSSLGVALWVLTLATGNVSDFWGGFKDAAKDNGSAYTLAKGECFDAPGGSLEGFTYDVDKVPCAGRHDGEVFAAFTMGRDTSYPGDADVTAVADTRCSALRYAYAMDAWAVPVDVDVYFLTPTRQSWRLGDREVTCVFGNTDKTAGLTGSLRNDGRSLNAHQLAYLRAVNLGNVALDGQPAVSPGEDLRVNTAWAGRVSDAFTKEAALLRQHAWPADAKSPVSAVVKEADSLGKQWAQVAAATDSDDFYAAYGRITVEESPRRSVTARKALGLATTPLVTDDAGDQEAGGGGDSDVEV
ncbi:DUF4190 domain-containing protein [Streptomyces gilvus]|uniref:DUF4190 domain-containing protein n=1 Tax=Streptomyces gilvus TaxID=2920937 RepID=UPI001F0D6A68|nr:DUF4190 domain-containing protein [Streptomyces sp. CME 23]MCH5672868.1 DUF4190 domain-containing protein [Streptomyces sp. CME 23]